MISNDKRPSKDTYFMDIAELCSRRSLDPDSKFGCVAVDKSGSILSTGYNGPPRCVCDEEIPLTRPEKYIYMEHSERNCIYNSARTGVSLEGATFYVTGIACVECMRAMYQVGAARIVMKTTQPNSATDDWFKFIEYLSRYVKIDYM